MAKKLLITLLGTIDGFVKSPTYGDHVRAPRGTRKKAELNADCQEPERDGFERQAVPRQVWSWLVELQRRAGNRAFSVANAVVRNSQCSQKMEKRSQYDLYWISRDPLHFLNH